MNFLEFIFFIISKNVNAGIDSDRKEQLRTDALAWYNNIQEDGTSKSYIETKFKKINEFWVFRLILALLAVPAVTYIRNLPFKNAAEIPTQQDKEGIQYPQSPEQMQMMMQMMQMFGDGDGDDIEIPDGWEVVQQG